jgi:hypothetical protein
MTQLDITLTDTNLEFEHKFEFGFFEILKLYVNNILIIKNFLFGLNNDDWLKQANKKVIDDIMSLKNKR